MGFIIIVMIAWTGWPKCACARRAGQPNVPAATCLLVDRDSCQSPWNEKIPGGLRLISEPHSSIPCETLASRKGSDFEIAKTQQPVDPVVPDPVRQDNDKI